MNKDYDGQELLDFCKLNPFTEFHNGRDMMTRLVSQILALVVTEKDPTELQEQIREEILKCTDVSIGKSLDRLTLIASIPQEFKGNADGVDALGYHLCQHSCESAIRALQAVLKRFKDTNGKLIVEE